MESHKKTVERKHYRICKSLSELEVERQVNDLMEQGWKPLGNLLVVAKSDASSQGQYIQFVQAMIKDWPG